MDKAYFSGAVAVLLAVFAGWNNIEDMIAENRNAIARIEVVEQQLQRQIDHIEKTLGELISKTHDHNRGPR